MEKFYTLLIATHELLTCPAIHSYARYHDGIAVLGETYETNLVLPTHFGVATYPNIHLEYNPSMVDVYHAFLHEVRTHYNTRTILTVSLIPRDMGTATIGVRTIMPSLDISDDYRIIKLHPSFNTHTPIHNH